MESAKGNTTLLIPRGTFTDANINYFAPYCALSYVEKEVGYNPSTHDPMIIRYHRMDLFFFITVLNLREV